MKRMLLLRHGKAKRGAAGDDRSRPLAPRGIVAAGRIGSLLAERGEAIDLVLCSNALRARQTLEALRIADAAVEFEDGLYLAPAAALVQRLRNVDEAVSSVLLVGHNPGLEDLVVSLTAASVPKFPTGALASLSYDGAWADLDRGGAMLEDLVVPR